MRLSHSLGQLTYTLMSRATCAWPTAPSLNCLPRVCLALPLHRSKPQLQIQGIIPTRFPIPHHPCWLIHPSRAPPLNSTCTTSRQTQPCWRPDSTEPAGAPWTLTWRNRLATKACVVDYSPSPKNYTVMWARNFPFPRAACFSMDLKNSVLNLQVTLWPPPMLGSFTRLRLISCTNLKTVPLLNLSHRHLTTKQMEGVTSAKDTHPVSWHFCSFHLLNHPPFHPRTSLLCTVLGPVNHPFHWTSHTMSLPCPIRALPWYLEILILVHLSPTLPVSISVTWYIYFLSCGCGFNPLQP